MTPLHDVHPPGIGLRSTQALAADDASVRVAHRGAQVLSWVCQGKERLFLSTRATSRPGQAIRGGVPVIFPQFGGAGNGLRHGFARLLDWKPLHGPGIMVEHSSSARFGLSANEQTRRTFPYDFHVELHVALTPLELSVMLEIENLDRSDFWFTAALHTYLRVADIGATQLLGLEGIGYLDSTNGGRHEPGAEKPLRFDGETDRIYPGASGVLLLSDGTDTVRIRSEGFPDTVVWNPGRALAASMKDLGDDQFHQFVCVESGVVAAPQVVPAGSRWRASQHLAVAKLATT